ncbi:ABC transporter ATP-binding protein [Planctellipticum variicoloris]|uniref:ABC transporter ATP-binding protein n=1 Tax=Planctellipticum variicoloris TaxID=3064265 RepID=UPI002C33E83E|nr:ABC transporter ATP-binding protein/permease [Planctomycetaceae bacterium SH412]HTN02092.1 ABC transporter ATP-binding protein [Planctomycetaceae bacterium]
MESLARLIPFVWRHRRDWALSVLAALGIAGLWVTALLLVYPLMTVLLKGQTVQVHVSAEIRRQQELAEDLTRRLVNARRELNRLAEQHVPAASRESVRALGIESGLKAKLAEAARQELYYRRLEAWLVPWLPNDRFQLLAVMMVGLLAMTAAKGVCVWAQEVLIGRVVQGTLMAVRERLFRRTLRLDFQTLAATGTPQLMSRFTYDLSQLQQGIELVGGRLIVEPLKLAGCLLFAFCINWRLTLFSLVTVPLIGLLFHRFGRRLKKASHRQLESMARIFRVLEETLHSFRVVQAFRNERLHRRRFAAENRDYFRRAMQIHRIDALTNPTIEMIATAAAFLALLPGAYLVLKDQTSIGGLQLATTPMSFPDLALLYTLLAAVLDPARKLSSVHAKLRKASAAADRIFGLLERTPAVVSGLHRRQIPAPTKELEFRHVTFHYDAAEEGSAPALDDVSATIPCGEIVAVVGGNGSGKSTLINLLPRFFDPQQGQVLIDGVDLRELPLRGLRSCFGLVTQETLLFDRSILENIRLGKPGASDTEIQEASRLAHVAEFAARLPHGLETTAGERGGRLSGGQKQRIALARAILRDPPILILDEATSAIDAESEQLIHRALQEFSRGRTVLIVTHAMSPALLKLVTQVMVMDRGRLLAHGPHEAVLKTCPAYRELFESQVRQRAA